MKVHDYRERHWGHDYTFRPAGVRRAACMTGWGPRTGERMQAREFILFRRPDADDKSLVLYQILLVNYRGDPTDMWHAEVEFVPRAESLRIMETSGLQPEAPKPS